MATLDPDRLQISLGTFTRLLVAPPGQQTARLRQQMQMYETDYGPGASFFQAFRSALTSGRAAGKDAEHLQRAVTKQRDPRRSEYYGELADRYLPWIATRPGASVLTTSARWSVPGLDVTVSADLAVPRHDGSTEIVKLYLAREPLTVDAGQATLRLLGKHMDALFPGGRPVVLDVLRGCEHRPRARLRRDFDAWMEAAAVGIAHLWNRMAA